MLLQGDSFLIEVGDIMKKLHKELQNYRFNNHLSQDALAKELNVSRQLISKWENGASVPNAEDLLAISKLLGMSTDELLAEENRPVLVQKSKKKFILGISLGSAGILILILCIVLPLCLIKTDSSDISTLSWDYSVYQENGESYISIDEIDASNEKKIEIPKTINHLEVRRIKKSAIVNADQLIEITLPFIGTRPDISEENAETEGHFSMIFANGNLPKNLVRVFFNGSKVSQNAFYGVTISEIYLSNEVKVIEEEAFLATKFTKLFFTNSLVEIKDKAFAGSRIQSITLPNGIQLGEGVFRGCTELEEVILPEDMEILPKETFDACSKLKKVGLPQSLTSIGEYCFQNCFSLKNIELPDELLSIETGAFLRTGLESINLPDKITELKEYTFYECTSLSSIQMPNGLTSIGDSCFSDNKLLLNIDLPASLSTLGNTAFSGSGLTSINLDNTKLTQIPIGCFYNCKNLTEVTLPISVTELQDSAFKACSRLSRISSLDKVSLLGDGVFANTCKLTHPNLVFGESILENTPVESITISYWPGIYELFNFSDPSSLKEVVLLNQKTLPKDAFRDCIALIKVGLPSNLEVISKYAFYGCTSLKELILPQGLKTIENYAFQNSSLESLSIPASIQRLEDYAFSGLDSLKNLTIPFLSNTYLKSCTPNLVSVTVTAAIEIPQYAFSGLSNLETVVLCDTIQSIGYRAFLDCNSLKQINIPKNLSYIDEYAFSGCSSLSYTTYKNGIYLGDSTNPYQVLIAVEGEIISSFYMHQNTKHIVRGALPDYSSNISNLYMSKYIPAREAKTLEESQMPFNIYFYGTEEEWEKQNYTFNYRNVIFNATE